VRICLLDLAELDLQEGYEFYELREIGVGGYFLDSLFAEIDSLVLYSGIHSKCFGYYRMLCSRFPYAVYYTIEQETVLVWRILDLRKNPEWIEEQLG
jgi:plasmid stabilization system protein ParE